MLTGNGEGPSLVLERLHPVPQLPQHITPHRHPPGCPWLRIPPRCLFPEPLPTSTPRNSPRHGKTCQGQDGVLPSAAKTISLPRAYKTRDAANWPVGSGGRRKDQLSTLPTHRLERQNQTATKSTPICSVPLFTMK